MISDKERPSRKGKDEACPTALPAFAELSQSFTSRRSSAGPRDRHRSSLSSQQQRFTLRASEELIGELFRYPHVAITATARFLLSGSSSSIVFFNSDLIALAKPGQQSRMWQKIISRCFSTCSSAHTINLFSGMGSTIIFCAVCWS